MSSWAKFKAVTSCLAVAVKVAGDEKLQKGMMAIAATGWQRSLQSGSCLLDFSKPWHHSSRYYLLGRRACIDADPARQGGYNDIKDVVVFVLQAEVPSY